MKFYFVLLTVGLLILKDTKGQTSKIKPVEIGEKVPEVIFKEIINYKVSSGKLSDFKGKSVILDFWDTHCLTCVAQFPKLQKLQEKFKDNLFILPVGYDVHPEMTIKDFVKKRKGTAIELRLPTVIRKEKDSTLAQLFPYRSAPHEIWIDADGVLRAITDHRALTEDNIKDFIYKKESHAVAKKYQMLINCEDEFLIKKNLNSKVPVYGSAFSNYNDSLKIIDRNFYTKPCGDSVNRLFWANKTVVQYYTFAYSIVFKDTLLEPERKRIILESDDINSFYKDKKDSYSLDDKDYKEFAQKNLFCYELILPGAYSVSESYAYMIQDLDRFFQIKSTIEERNIKYLALIQTNGEKKFIPGNPSEPIKAQITKDSISVKNYPIDALISQLNIISKQYYIINETGYSQNVDILIPAKGELSTLQAALNKYGFDLIIKEKKMPMLILKDLRSQQVVNIQNKQ